MRTTHIPTLLLGLTLGLATAACGDDGTGDDDDDGTGTGGSSSGTPCQQLAEKCPRCTIPQLQLICENAVATNDTASCEDGLTDPDIRANCN